MTDTQGAGYGSTARLLEALACDCDAGEANDWEEHEWRDSAELLRQGSAAIQTLTTENERLEADLARAREALEPFAKAALGVETFDPDFPADGAALRASFDWYDKVQSEPLKRHSVRRSDLDRAREALTELSEPKS